MVSKLQPMAYPDKMRAVYFDSFGSMPKVMEVPVPLIGSESVLLEVKATGICRSDWHGWMGHDKDIRLPHVPGHEFAGIIVQLGNGVGNWRLGQRVTTPFVQACGRCPSCIQNEQQVCEFQEQAGFTHWGSYAEFVEVRNADINLVEIPGTMSFDQAAMMGCRFGTAYRALVDQAKVQKNDFILVLGCGGVGLSFIQIARAMGIRVAAADINPEALKLAGKSGAEILIHPVDPKLVDTIWQWSENGVTACFDAVGVPAFVDLGLKTLRRRGKYVQVGLLPDQLGKPSISMERLVAHELEILGSHGIQAWKYKEMLEFVQTSGIDLDSMISKTCTLEESIDILTRLNLNLQAGMNIIHPGGC